MKPDRKEFLKTALVVAGAGFGLANGIGCSSSDTPAVGGTGGHNGTGGSGSGGSSSGSGGAGSGGTTGSGGSGTGGSGSGGSGTGGAGTGGAGTGGAGTGGSGSGGSGTGGSGTGGSGAGGSSGANACDAHEPMETILTNHPAGSEHIMMVAAADVTAGVNKTYSIQGNSKHDHMVTITAADFTKLKAGMQFMMTSTTGGMHTHVVRVICA